VQMCKIVLGTDASPAAPGFPTHRADNGALPVLPMPVGFLREFAGRAKHEAKTARGSATVGAPGGLSLVRGYMLKGVEASN